MDQVATDNLIPIASRLAQADIVRLTPAASGGNSRIYRVQTTARTYALKYYPPVVAGARNRLGSEVAALRFFNGHQIAGVPNVYGYEDRFALYDWVEGSIPTTVTQADIDAAAEFLAHFPKLSTAPEAAAFGFAAEACLSLDELLSQIARRLERLQQVASAEPALHEFLQGTFADLHKRDIAQAHATWKAQGWEPAAELPHAERSLVPGDFGFHNVLKNSDGKLAFIDFEYFGWDDPVKLAADTLLHPGYSLSPQALQHLQAHLLGIFSKKAGFAPRLQALLPLFSLRWALILCNEFLEEKRVNRAFAANIAERDEAEWERRKQAQLAKARAMLVHPALSPSLSHAV